MRVAIYSDCDSRGGVLVYTLTLSKALRDRGAHVTILTHEPPDSFSKAIVDDMVNCASNVERLPPESHSAIDAQLLSAAILQSHADVYVPNYRLTPYAAAALCSRRGLIRAIGVCHNDHPSYYDLLKRFESCLTRMVCANAKTSNQISSRLPWRASDVVTIPHGVRIPEQPCRPFTGGELRLIYHGRLIEEQKRISLILEVARRLGAQQVSFHLTIIGDGPAKAKCLLAAEKPMLRERISILDSQDWPTLSSHLINSHVAVLTSEYEGFGLSIAEAMGAGLPAVAFQCGGVIEEFLTHEHTGLLLAPGDVDNFAMAIARLQANPILWSKLSFNARALIIREYSWSAAVTKYLDLLENTTRDPIRRRWSVGRPAWISPNGRTFRSAIERTGKIVKLWR